MNKHDWSRFLAAVAATFAAVAASAIPVGVTVNGTPLDSGGPSYGAGWLYDPGSSTLFLFGTGPFTLSGINVIGGVRVVISESVTSMVAFSNITLRATGDNRCAFALETNACVSLFLAGENTLMSGENRAGVEVAAGRTLSVTHASDDAMGSLTAMGGDYGAGIGGGDQGAGGTVTINGGMVVANGGLSSAGIGGGWSGAGGTVTVNGGTVFAQSGAGGTDIGSGYNGAISGANLFTGGSIRLANDTITPAPSNGTARVWCVTVPGLTPGAAVEIALPAENLPAYFGVNGLFADAVGCIYLWLPDGDYAFTANNIDYTATVDGAAVTASVSVDAPLFATAGTALVFDGVLLSIKITNAQNGVMYTLYATDTLGGSWILEQVVQAQADGDLVFENISASPTKRFFKVGASASSPQ